MGLKILHFNQNNDPTSYPRWTSLASGKAIHDRETFAQELGAKLVYADTNIPADEPAESLQARVDTVCAGLERDDIFMLHWPLEFDNKPWLEALIPAIHAREAKLVFIVDDIQSWRRGNEIPEDVQPADYDQYKNALGVDNEGHFLPMADGLILLSEPMMQRLAVLFHIAGNEMPAAVTYGGPGGFRTTYFQKAREYGKGLDYAGSLHKAMYVFAIRGIHVSVFGAFSDLDLPDNIEMMHWIDPEATPSVLHNSFGLIWDSDTYPTVTGNFGKYERYNTPAKFDLYLAANEPVILWDQSPLAKFVEDNDIGFAVSTLEGLADKVNAIDKPHYDTMVQNATRIGGLIRSGYYIKQAILDMQGKLLDRHQF